MADPEPYGHLEVARKAIEDISKAVYWMDNLNKAHLVNVRGLRAQLEEQKQRADIYEQRADEYQNKAARTDQLEEACEKLIAAFERLPLKMADAGMAQTPTPSDIPLYDTYDWQAVMDAKLALMAAMKRST